MAEFSPHCLSTVPYCRHTFSARTTSSQHEKSEYSSAESALHLQQQIQDPPPIFSCLHFRFLRFHRFSCASYSPKWLTASILPPFLTTRTGANRSSVLKRHLPRPGDPQSALSQTWTTDSRPIQSAKNLPAHDRRIHERKWL